MGSIDDYQKARGYKPAHPKTKENLGEPTDPLHPDNWDDEPISRPNWVSRNGPMLLSVLFVSCLVGGVVWYFTKPKVEKVVEKPPIKMKEKIVYRNKYITKWKTRIVEKPVEIVKWRTKIKYIKDPNYDIKIAELEANHARRMKMLRQFYEQPLKPGEKRQLTFESSCPGFKNEKHVRPAVSRY